MTAASQARRRLPEAEITVIERGRFVSFILCGLPYYVADVVQRHEALLAYPLEAFRRERRLDVRTRHEAVALDPKARTVEVVDRDTGTRTVLPYDRLVLAAGAHASRPPVPGINLTGVFTLHSLEAGIELKEFLARERPGRAVIVGGGYVGLEMAEAFRARGQAVTLLEAAPQLLPGSAPEIAALVGAELERHGVDLRLETPVEGISGDANGRVRSVTAGGAEIPADVVLLAVGVRAESALARDAGIAIGRTGAIAVDERLATNYPEIYAAGDGAEALHVVTGRPAYVPLGTTANKQGRVAGENAAGGEAVFRGIAGTAGFKTFDLEVARTGLTDGQAVEAGFRPVATTIVHHTRAPFYPGAAKVTLRLTADAVTGRLLGGQMAGASGEGIAKRMDTIAAALHAGLSLEALESLDLTYAPPFAAAWEAAHLAARELRKRMAEARAGA